MRTGLVGFLLYLLVGLAHPSQFAAPPPQRVTILYDAFGAPAMGLRKDWGFAALVEYGGRRILFDTGNDARIFEENVDRLGIDLSRLDAVIVSHRHGDHTSGLTPLLRRNPRVPIYAPQEGAMFRSTAGLNFIERQGRAGDLPRLLRHHDALAEAGDHGDE